MDQISTMAVGCQGEMYLLIKTVLTSSQYAVCVQFLSTFSVCIRMHVHADDFTFIGTAKTLENENFF